MTAWAVIMACHGRSVCRADVFFAALQAIAPGATRPLRVRLHARALAPRDDRCTDLLAAPLATARAAGAAGGEDGRRLGFARSADGGRAARAPAQRQPRGAHHRYARDRGAGDGCGPG